MNFFINGNDVMLTCLCKLFIAWFSSGYFPIIWSDGLLVPLFKKISWGEEYRKYGEAQGWFRRGRGITYLHFAQYRQYFSLHWKNAVHLIYRLFRKVRSIRMFTGSATGRLSITLPLLLYADDVILLSDTSEGLQLSLNIHVLNQYCNIWKPKLNVDK